MARFTNAPPTNPAPRASEAADENAGLELPGAATAAESADIPETGIPDALPIIAVENITEHLPEEAEDVLDDFHDLFGFL
ncbi:MAG: hypothetical protein ACU0DI_00795 [Paracoccaceae bacterium]